MDGKFYEGYRSYHARYERTHNPYAADCKEHDEWNAGFDTASSDFRMVVGLPEKTVEKL